MTEPNNTKGTKISVRLTEEESTLLELSATVRGSSLADVVREIGVDAAVAEGRRILALRDQSELPLEEARAASPEG